MITFLNAMQSFLGTLASTISQTKMIGPAVSAGKEPMRFFMEDSRLIVD
jgi:hypothetical protein